MKAGSLFSGIGGIELGLEKAGFKTVWFIEKEPYLREVLKKNFEGAKIYDDIRKAEFEKLERVDILTGGFPCQNVSNAGDREGIHGVQSSLWRFFARAIRILRPEYVLIENVSALTIRGLDTVLADLAKSGYDAEWDCLPASALGAPHRRDRIFIVAYPQSKRHEGDWPNREQEQPARPDEGQPSGHCNAPNPSSKGLPRGTENKLLFGRQGRMELEKFRNAQGRSQWEIEPEVGRVVDGISRGLDNYIWKNRIKALGNAVVPQVAEMIGLRIMEVSKHDRNKNIE